MNKMRWDTKATLRFCQMWQRGASIKAMAGYFRTSTYAISERARRIRQEGVPLADRSTGERSVGARVRGTYDVGPLVDYEEVKRRLGI